ncbi:DUF6683 family protein [Azomonas macrocytogenes]|uniref:Uncharacterized protein n=1 Tax=Azomonas macrocytogenes TaxID=69962 RepID=A0A839SZN4_AZOMA|nr:DUF6683 family protein [Azomonas macrocytogenes]MBB3102791.1 hypothetical protein [Azomonas macrocytogenes]
MSKLVKTLFAMGRAGSVILLALAGMQGVAHADEAAPWQATQSLRGSEASGLEGGSAHRPASANAEVAAPILAFKPSPRITAEVNRQLADGFASGDEAAWPDVVRQMAPGALDDQMFRRMLARPLGTSREQMLDSLASGKVQSEFRKMLDAAGYHENDVGDAAALFMICAWSIVHDQLTIPQGAFEAARAIMARHERGDEITRIGDEEKQASAESFAIMTLLIGAASEQGLGVDRQNLQRGVRQMVKNMGTDLDEIVLTENGFIPKS